MYLSTGFHGAYNSYGLVRRISGLSILSVPVCRVHVVFSTAGFKGSGKSRLEAHEITALQKGIQKALLT